MVKLSRSLLVVLAVVVTVGAILKPHAVAAQEHRDSFYIFGVKNPGRYLLKEGTTVVAAVESAGGAVSHGFATHTVIARFVDGKRVVIDAAPQDIVKTDDVIQVRRAD